MIELIKNAAQEIARQVKVDDTQLPAKYKGELYKRIGIVAGMIIGGIIGGIVAPTNLGVSLISGISLGGLAGLIVAKVIHIAVIKIFKPGQNTPSFVKLDNKV